MKKFFKKSLSNFKKINPKKKYGLVFVLVIAAFGVIFLTFSRAATVPTLSLSPSSSSIGLGGSFTVQVLEDSQAVSINAVQADLTYDKTKLQLVSIDATTSAFSIEAEKIGSDGVIKIGRGSTTPFTGVRTVASLTFKGISPGPAVVSFSGTSGLITSDTNKNVLAASSGGTYNVLDNVAPTAPDTVVSSGATATSISLSWNASTDNVKVTGYDVYRDGTKVGSSAGTTYINNGLSPSKQYSYTVKAFDAAGNNSVSSVAKILSTTADTTKPSVVSGINKTNSTLTSISLSWNASTDNVKVTGYDVYRDGTKVGSTATDASPGTTYTDNGLTPGKSYTYIVRAFDAAKNLADNSSSYAASTLADTVAPSIPGGLTIASQTSTGVSLVWSASTDNVKVTGYDVYRDGIKVASTTGTGYGDSNLIDGNTYAYSIKAYDAAGNVSGYSSTVSVSIKTRTGDVNGDDTVNIFDLSVLSSNFGKSGASRSMGDLNADGVVNIFDLSILCTNWGK